MYLLSILTLFSFLFNYIVYFCIVYFAIALFYFDVAVTNKFPPICGTLKDF